MTPFPLEGPHWSFALRLYARPGVAEACLVLQDRAGVDVNVLLFALFAAAERGIALGPRELQDLDAAVAAWRSEVVQPLRSVRRRLKEAREPAPREVAEALRGRINAAEIEAEQIEQALLASWLDGRRQPEAPEPAPDLRAILEGVVEFFAARSAAPPDAVANPEIGDALRIVLEATGQPRRLQ